METVFQHAVGTGPQADRRSDISRLIVDNLDDGIYVVDRERRIAHWNDGAERITGYLRQDVIGRRCMDNLLVHCNTEGVSFCANGCPLQATMEDGKPRRVEAFLRHHEGHRVPVTIRASAVRDKAGAIVGAVEIFHSEPYKYGLSLKLSGLEQYGCLDPETGLANREMTRLRLQHRLEDLHRFGIPVGIFIVEIEERERIVARGGCAAWQALLRPVARTMAETIPPNGFLGRWEEHLFVGLLGNSDPMGMLDVTSRIAGLVEATDVQWWGDSLQPRVTVRGAMAEPGDSPESIVARLLEQFPAPQATGRGPQASALQS